LQIALLALHGDFDMLKVIRLPATAQEMEREWREQGWIEGAPAHIPPELLLDDFRLYARLRCGQCGSRRHRVTAFHVGRDYRLLCCCKECGTGMEG
jgi:hypothetical protein